MKRLISIIYCLAFYIAAHGQSVFITGRVVDKSMAPIPDACVMVYAKDSALVASGFCDASGAFRVRADSISGDKVKISHLGYKTEWKSLPIKGDIVLSPDSMLLSEVVVKGKKTFTRQTSTGFIYDLESLDFVKDQSLLQALRLVPLIDIDSKEEISVKGSRQYALYLNGKPFDMGMANPAQILRSLRARNVKKIEVVTKPDFRFSDKVPVINIITSRNALDGIYLNASAKYETVPNAKAGASFLAKKEHVDFSLSYDYDYKSQLDQSIFQSITMNDNTTTLDGKGDGHWNTHTLRALASWRIDTLNTIYADVHAKINNNHYDTQWTVRSVNPTTGTTEENRERNKNEATMGTVEANVIYRNFYRHDNARERFMVGYRYAYNPDKRHYTITDLSGETAPLSQKTSGGINEHTLNMQATMPLSSQHQLSVGARTIYRKADVNSTEDPDLSYKQSITYPYVSYLGALKWFNASIDLSCEYEYLSMRGEGDEYHATSRDFYFLPSITLYRSLGNWNVNVMYGRSLKRPSIVMLNPFQNNENEYFLQTGNPELKAETDNVVSIGASYFKNRLSLSMGVNYSYTDDAILPYQKASQDLGGIVSTYDNIGRLNTLTGNVFVYWQPITPLVVKLNVNGGLYDMKSSRLGLSQTDYTLNVFGWIDYYLPRNWSVGANVIHFKQAPEPFGTVNHITNYAFHVSKSWLKGALSATLEIATPFSEYAKLKTTTSNGAFSTRKVNYMNARLVGLNISYTFQRGKKSNLKRDSSLVNTDQDSGVR